MMKKSGYILSAAGLLLFAAVAAAPAEFAGGVSRGLQSCGEVIIPSLFGFTAAAGLLGCGELPVGISKAVSPAMRKAFGLSGECLPALLLGMLGGYPTGAAAARTLLNSGKISQGEARRLTSFCLSPGIGFCINAVGASMLGSRRSGALILASVCIAMLPIGVISKYISKAEPPPVRRPAKPLSLPNAAVGSITACAEAMLSICAFVSLFSGLASVAARFIPSGRILTAVMLLSEVTSGCLASAGRLPLPLLCAECAFGGLCVHMQVFAVSGEADPPKGIFFIFRIIHAALSSAICAVLLRFFPVTQQTFAAYGEAHAWSRSAPASVSLLFLCAVLILDLDTCKKKC